MDNTKEVAVLAAAREFFLEEESHGHPAVINNGPRAIGEKLGLSPAEVLVLLRGLHRKGMIGLLGGVGPHIMVARDHEALRTLADATIGGKNVKRGRARHGHPASDEESTGDVNVSELQKYIIQLEKVLDDVQARLEQAEKRHRNISDARRRSDEATASAEKELQRVKAENRALARTIETLQAEADKVPNLERKIAELGRPRSLPDDLAAMIDRLTRDQ